ncbi:MAG TPA: hypothetical protein VKR28_07755, partial [Candidatus Binatus sp.]|nr:hypothetical protein [Candidatus Binatus sp.]
PVALPKVEPAHSNVPAELSIPQTRAQLPSPQPLDPAALATAPDPTPSQPEYLVARLGELTTVASR